MIGESFAENTRRGIAAAQAGISALRANL